MRAVPARQSENHPYVVPPGPEISRFANLAAAPSVERVTPVDGYLSR